MQRVMILGGPGAGKSTMAREIGAWKGIPVIHMDPMYWKPHWVQRAPEETMALVTEAAARPRWIIDGNHLSSFAMRAARSDVVIFLDLPVWQRIGRLFRRRWQYRGQVRPGMPEGCTERLTLPFLWFALRYRSDGRQRTKALLREWEGRLWVVKLRTAEEAEVFLSGLAGERKG